MPRPLAVGVDIRTRDFDGHRPRAPLLSWTLEMGGRYSSRCNNEELQQRYEVTRHRHPLAQDRPVADGITHERRLLTSLRDGADLVIDTTGMAPGGLGILQGQFGDGAERSLTIF